ncbi:MAG: hypothetical protein EU544_04800 [Promethearchaeota archaeon]|nr:MAG: hypothetical protein EU544_04800 [Candidatus Lokiarchaeota archaeon]
MKQKTLGIICILMLTCNMVLIMPTLVLGELDTVELSSDLTELNADLQEKLFKDEVTGGLESLGDEEGNKVGESEAFAIENSIATAAFYNRYSRSGNAECDDWGENEAFPAVSGLEANNKLYRQEEDPTLYYTADQAIAVEFLSIGYEQSQNQEILPLLENVYSSLDDFESNDTDGYKNAYWQAINEEGYRAGSEYCLTNVSLWTIVGLLGFGLTVKGLTIDNEEQYSVTSIDIAEKIIEFCEDECFYNGSGFLEYPYADFTNPETQNFYFNTQALAVLAYTRLYEATQKQVYLDKAELFVKYIITLNFLDTGKTGGCVSYFSQADGTKSDVKKGFDNALYAYALIQLYEATSETEYSHLRRAEEIVVFMNDELYQESEDGEILGYVELLVDGDVPDDYEIRLWKTNALMLFVNEEIIWYERPWYIKYLWWIIIGSIVIVAIIVIVILIRKRRNIGTKLPKMVKGLVEE